MKKKGNQLLSLLLSAVMVLSLLPSITLPARAEETTTASDDLTSLDEAAAWHFDTDQPESSKERVMLGENPLSGTDDTIGILGSAPLEIFVTGGDAALDNASRTYNKEDLNSIYWYDNLKTSGGGYLESTEKGYTGVTGVTPSGSEDVMPSATVGADLNGDGIDELLRYYVEIEDGSGTVVNDLDGFNSGKSGYTASFKLQAINTQTGKQVASVTLGTFSHTANDSFYIPDSIYYYPSYMQITAADYNGDGKDEVAVAVPDQNNQNASSHLGNVSVYALSGTALTKTGNKSVTFYSRYGDSDAKINFSSFCLTSGDSDNDGKPELLFTEMDDVINVDEESSLYVIDYSDGSYTSPMNRVSLEGDDGSDFGNAGITVGDIDNDGLKEIVYGGYMVNSDNKADSAEFSYDDGTKQTITFYHELAMNYMKYDNKTKDYYYSNKGFTVLRKEDATAISCVDGGSTKYDASSSRRLSNAHRYPNSQNWTVPIQSVSLTGFVNGNANDQIFFGDMLYYYNASIGRFDVYDDSKKATTDTIAYNSFDTPNSAITALIPGSYLSEDSNYAPSDGRQQLLVAYAKRDNDQTHNAFEYALLYESAGGTAMDVQKQRNRLAKTGGGSVNSYDYCPSVCALNADDDAIFTQYIGYDFTYTKPEVLTVMASVPYYQDIYGAYHNGPGSTYITNTTGSSTKDTASTSVSLGWYASFSQDIGVFGVKLASIEMENSFTASTSYEYSKTVEKEASISYKTYGGQDSVVMTSSPVDTYFYRYYKENDEDYAAQFPNAKRSDPGTWGIMPVSLPGEPQTIVYSVADYNKLAAKYNLTQIDGTFWTHTIGDPGTYPTSPNDFIGAKNLQYVGNTASTTHGTGSVTTQFTTTTSEENSYGFSLSLATKFGAGVGGLITGATFECESGYSGSTAKYKGTTIGAELENYPDEDGYATKYYNLSTQIYSYTKELNGNDVMVLDFTVSNIHCLPMLPENFRAVSVGADSIQLGWTVPYGISNALRPDHYRLEQYDEFYQTWSVLKDNIPASGGDGSYLDAGLYPSQAYNYRMIAVDSTGVRTNTLTLDVTTKKSGSVPIIKQQPQDITVGAGDNASLSVVAEYPPNAEAGRLYYQWYDRENAQKSWNIITGATNKTLALTGVTKEMNGYQYYCTVSRMLDGDTLSVDSDYVSLSVLDHTPKLFTVKFSAASGGSITAMVVGTSRSYEIKSGDQVYEGTKIVYNVAEDSGYHVSNLMLNGKFMSVISYSYTVDSVNQDITFAAYFLPIMNGFKYYIEDAYKSMGTVSAYYGDHLALPASADTYNTIPMSKLPIVLTAVPGASDGVQYCVSGWWINGKQKTNADGSNYVGRTLTLDTLYSYDYVYVRFEASKKFSISLSSKFSSGDSVSVDNSVVKMHDEDGNVIEPGADISQGTDVIIDVTPPSASIISLCTMSKVDQNGKPSGEATVLGGQQSYRIEAISSNYAIQFGYLLYGYTPLTYGVSGGNGTITASLKGTGMPKVTSGKSIQMYTDVLFTAMPADSSLGVKGWTVNGVYTKSTSPTYELDNIYQKTNVNVQYETVPQVVSPVPSQQLILDDTRTIDISGCAADSDGDKVSVAGVTDNAAPGVAKAEMGTGSDAGKLTLTALSPGCTSITVRYQDENGHFCDAYIPVSVQLKGQTVSPAGLTAVASSMNTSDGKITGLDTEKGYQFMAVTDYTSADAKFTDVSAGAEEITGLAPGEYLVRYVAASGFTPSTFARIVVPTKMPSPETALSGMSYSINGTSVSLPDFGADTLNYYVNLDANTPDGTAVILTGTQDKGTLTSPQVSGTLKDGKCALALQVTSEIGNNTRNYTVLFERAYQNSEAKMYGFQVQNGSESFSGNVDESGKTVSVMLPKGTDLSKLTPTFAVSKGASVSVLGVVQTSGASENSFAQPVIYTVTAENGVKTDYTVTIQTEQSEKTYHKLGVSVKTGCTDMGIVTGGGSVGAGDTAYLTAVPADGYKFSSWNVTGADAQTLGIGINDAATSITMPEEDVTIEAVFVAKTAPKILTPPDSYEKYNDDPSVAIFSVSAGDYTLEGIDGVDSFQKNNNQYNFDIYISSNTLEKMEAGIHMLRLRFNGGVTLPVELVIKDSTPHLYAIVLTPATKLMTKGDRPSISVSFITKNYAGTPEWSVDTWHLSHLIIYENNDNTIEVSASAGKYNGNISFKVSTTDPAISAQAIIAFSGASQSFSKDLPASAAYYAGQPGPTLSVKASGDDSYISYQWYKNSKNSTDGAIPIYGVSGTSYTLPTTMTTGDTYYYVTATSNYPGSDPVSWNSAITMVTVNAATSAAQPNVSGVTGKTAYTQGDTVGIDDALKVSATAIDSGTLSYAWYLKASSDGGTDTLVGSDASFSPPTDTVGTFDYYVVVTNTVTGLSDCSVTSDPLTVTVEKDTRSSAKAITGFTIDGVDEMISESDHTIAVTLPYGTDITSLTPTITVSANATVSPTSGTAQDFTSPVTYKVTAENGSTQDYIVTVTVETDTRSSAKAITGFTIDGVDGMISESDYTIAVTLPYGTDITSLTPTITVSANASVSSSGTAQDFTEPVRYTVTAEDESTQDYIVTVTVEADTQSSAKAITGFTIDGVDGMISESDHTIAVTLPYGTDITSLTPTITVSANASVSSSGTAQDFTNPVRYTVTAEDESTQDYIVTVTISDESTYGISLSRTTDYTFTGQTAGYSAVTPLSVTVTSTGNQATGDLTAILSGTNSGSFTLSKTSISSIASGGTGSFTVVPNTGLSAGTYTATVTVAGDNVTSQMFKVSFTVSSASTGGNTGGAPTGGGSSTSTSSNITVTTDNNTTTATQSVTATIASNGVAAANVTSSQISEMLTAAEAKAASNAQTTVNLQVATGSGATGVSVILPQSAVSTLTGGEASLTVSSTVATVTLDSATLAEIGKQTSGDITIAATEADTSTLSADTKITIGTRPVYDLKITSGNTTISSFGGGTATVSVPYTPSSGEDVNAIVVYYINASGELVTVPNCSYDAKTGTVTFTTTHFSTYAIGYNAVSFSDVSGSAWYADYVAYLAARGIVGGNSGAFNPNASITRAEFVAILARMSGESLSGYTTSTFLDVSTDSWYFAAVQWANKAGITSGYNGKFNPSATITREQMAAMLYRYAEYKGTASNTEGMSAREFSDYDHISSWAQAPIQWAMSNGILSGNMDGSFAPQSSATRAQAAKILAMLLQSM